MLALRPQLLENAACEHLLRYFVGGRGGNNDVGKPFGRFHKRLVHGSYRTKILVNNAFDASAALAHVAHEASQNAYVGIHVYEHLYIHKVADFFRYKIKNDDNISTIQEELQAVDDYIYILNVRYAGEIHFNKVVDEKYLGVSVPSMILQPIVENCIKHGFHEIDWEKKIDISITGEDRNIVISVRDNGIGIPGNIIEKIMNNTISEDKNAPKRDGIGLDNVITRLKTFFECDNVVEITSVGKNMGTEIALFIPKEVKEKR